MRASDFLSEWKKSKKKKSFTNRIKAGKNLADRLRKECSVWYSQCNGGKRMLFRGTSAAGSTFVKVKVRQDRRPMDTGQERHDAFNQIIADKGLVANRSNSLFCTTDRGTASEYGNECVIFPIGMFNYTWSPKYRDWTNDFDVPGLNDSSLSKKEMDILRGIFVNGIKTKDKSLTKIVLERMQRIMSWASKTERARYNKNMKLLTKHALDKVLYNLKYDVSGGRKLIAKHAPDKVQKPKAHNASKFNIQGDNGTLGKAFESFSEIMIHCPTAYIIDYDFYVEYVLPYL